MVEFSLLVLLAAIAVLFAMNLSLAARLRRLEARLGAGGAPEHVANVAAPAAGTGAPSPKAASPAPQSTSLATLFENWIGGSLLIWVGGVALVVAAVFLIRFSIEIGLITPELRMIAAAAFGLLLLALGEWARSAKRLADDPRVSQALVGAGLAILYASVYGSYILYGFIGIRAASVLMLAITAAALGLSLRHGAGTAAMGLIGGFLTPWLVGDPDAGALPLIFYLILLDLAVFAIAWKRGWGWLAGVAVLASFAWSAVLLFGPAPDAVAAGWFILALGVLATAIRPPGASLEWLQAHAIAAVLLTILAARGDVAPYGWLLFGAIAVASVALARLRDHQPWVPLLVLVLGLALLPVKSLIGIGALHAPPAAGLTILFGGAAAALAFERRSRAWAALACAGFVGPALVLRADSPVLLSVTGWGLLFVLLALGPLLLVWARRAQPGAAARLDFFALVPALSAAGLLALAALDLVRAEGLSIAWLVLSIAFIAAGMALAERTLRLAGLILLTLTVCKLFLIDAAALDGILRILSFFGLGAALIVLGRFYGTLLRAERKASTEAAAGSGQG